MFKFFSQLQQLSSTSSIVQVNERDLALAHQFFDGSFHGQGLVMPLQAGSTPNQTPEMYEPWSLMSQPEKLLHDGPAAQAAWAAEFSDVPQNYSSDPPAQQGISTSSSGNFTVIILVTIYSRNPSASTTLPSATAWLSNADGNVRNGNV